MNIPEGGLEQFCEMEIDSANLSDPESNTTDSTPASSPDDQQKHTPEQFSNQQLIDDNLRSANYYQASVTSSTSTCGSVTASGSATRRHTVGPGDVSYEQSLSSHPHQAPMINFKFGGDGHLAANLYQQQDQSPLLPIDLPTLQNQPLINFSLKNHHLLKPPTVMENSALTKYGFYCVYI